MSTRPSTGTQTSGFKALNNLSAALELEKNALLAEGKISDSLEAKVGQMIEDNYDISVPVSKEESTEYTKLANAICTLKDDIKSGLFTPSERERAVDVYLDLLSFINEVKKKE